MLSKGSSETEGGLSLSGNETNGMRCRLGAATAETPARRVSDVSSLFMGGPRDLRVDGARALGDAAAADEKGTAIRIARAAQVGHELDAIVIRRLGQAFPQARDGRARKVDKAQAHLREGGDLHLA